MDLPRTALLYLATLILACSDTPTSIPSEAPGFGVTADVTCVTVAGTRHGCRHRESGCVQHGRRDR